jgi:tetratricopeptide (TPR) repeat protein
MWKWLLALGIVALVVCAGAVGGGAWYGLKWQAAQEETARIQTEDAAKAAEGAARVMAGQAAQADHLLEARAALAAEDHVAAEAAFSLVLEADPTSVEALIGRGRCYAHLERYELAESDLRAVTRDAPDRKDAWEALAWVLTRMSRDDEAVDALDHLLALDGADTKALWNRASARFHAGDAAGALTDARGACELGFAEGCALEERIRASMRR